MALVAGGLGIRIGMQMAPGAVPFVTFYPVVACAGLIPGVAPGLLALALAIGFSWFVVLPPAYSFSIESWSDIAGLLVFAAMGVGFLAGGAALKNAFVQILRERDAYIAKAELRVIVLRALRYCIGHYLRGLSNAMQKQRALRDGSICHETLDNCIARLDALERLYRRLYAPEEFGTGSAGLFIEDVCRDLVVVAAVPQVRCRVTSQAVWLAADHRVALGLIGAELRTDALERAPETPSTIDIVLGPAEPGRVSLAIQDVGGRTSSADREEVCHHIPALTRALTTHLGGTVKCSAGGDGSVTVTVVLPCHGSAGVAGGVWPTESGQ